MPKTALTQHEVEQKLIAIISRLLDYDAAKITPDSLLHGGELPFDSLGVAEFMMEVEDAFDLNIDEEAHAKAFPEKPATVRTLGMLIVQIQRA